MFNMLHGECYKLKKCKSFYICIAVVTIFAALLYGSLDLLDSIQQMEVEVMKGDTGEEAVEAEMEAGVSGGLEVNSDVELELDEEEPISFKEQIGIIGVVEQMFASNLVGFAIAIFISIFVIGEYGNGTMKNLVGKGYSRDMVFLSKLLAAVFSAALMSLLITALTVLLGLPFMGSQGFAALDWKDLAAYTGMQLAFVVSYTSVAVMIGEVTRSLAAGISLNMAILCFSTTATGLLDLFLDKYHIEISKFWILNLQAKCPVSDLGQEFAIRGLLVSLGWFLLAAGLGLLHFKKRDVK